MASPGNLSGSSVLRNMSWLIGDRAMRILVGIVVSVWVARYLGPEQFGTLSYSIAFAGVFYTIATLGVERVVVRELIQYPEKTTDIMGSAALLRISAGLVLFPIALIMQWWMESTLLWYVFLASFGLLFQFVDVIDLYFQSRLESRRTVMVKNFAYLLMAAVKIVLIQLKAPLAAFIVCVSFEYLFVTLGLLVYACRMSWNVSGALVRQLFSESYMGWLALVAYVIFSRIDQLVLVHLLDAHYYGMYSAAVRLYEMPLFFVAVVSSSIYPILVKMCASDMNRFWSVYLAVSSATTWVALVMVVVVFVAGDMLVLILLGRQYDGVSDMLKVLSIAWVFFFNGALRAAYLSLHNRQGLLLKAVLVGMFVQCIAYGMIVYFKLAREVYPYVVVVAALTVHVISNMSSAFTRELLMLQLKAFNPKHMGVLRSIAE